MVAQFSFPNVQAKRLVNCDFPDRVAPEIPTTFTSGKASAIEINLVSLEHLDPFEQLGPPLRFLTESRLFADSKRAITWLLCRESMPMLSMQVLLFRLNPFDDPGRDTDWSD